MELPELVFDESSLVQEIFPSYFELNIEKEKLANERVREAEKRSEEAEKRSEEAEKRSKEAEKQSEEAKRRSTIATAKLKKILLDQIANKYSSERRYREVCALIDSISDYETADKVYDLCQECESLEETIEVVRDFLVRSARG